MSINKMARRDTLCWTCQNACGGCSWSRKFKPVQGWTAERRDVKMYHVSKSSQAVIDEESYVVFECPEYVPDPPRKKLFSWMADRCVECNSLRACATYGPICRKVRNKEYGK